MRALVSLAVKLHIAKIRLVSQHFLQAVDAEIVLLGQLCQTRVGVEEFLKEFKRAVKK